MNMRIVASASLPIIRSDNRDFLRDGSDNRCLLFLLVLMRGKHRWPNQQHRNRRVMQHLFGDATEHHVAQDRSIVRCHRNQAGMLLFRCYNNLLRWVAKPHVNSDGEPGRLQLLLGVEQHALGCRAHAFFLLEVINRVRCVFDVLFIPVHRFRPRD